MPRGSVGASNARGIQMSRVDIYRTEITGDPLTRGYSGLTDVQIRDDLNTAYRTQAIDQISVQDFHANLDATEYAALVGDDASDVRDMFFLAGGFIDVSSGSFARTRLLVIFPGGTTTRTNLLGLFEENITRAAELGAPNAKLGEIEEARR